MTDMDIDLVYLWVDGNDPKWRAKRDVCLGLNPETTASSDLKEVNCEGRYADNDELKYSLRSVEKYAPWLRKIFIVTNDQVPRWLDTTNPKVRIVDHTEILPKEAQPAFSCIVIEHHLHRIPELAEHFLYSNDDMFFNRPVKPSDFFAEDGLPIIRLNRRPFRKWELWIRTQVLHQQLTNYLKTIDNSARLVEKIYGKYYTGKTHHNIDAYLRSDFQETRELFSKEIDATLQNRVRSDNDIQRGIYFYVALHKKRGHLQYVDQHTSFRFHINNHKHYGKFLRYKPLLFCMNDSQYATDEDRKLASAFLARYFPEKSQFEK